MSNINILEKNIENRKLIIEKLMLNPIQNKKAIENATKYINKTKKKIKRINVLAPIEQKSSTQSGKKAIKDTNLETLIIDTSERKTISIRVKVGVLESLKKEHLKYQTLINAILESYVINKKNNI